MEKQRFLEKGLVFKRESVFVLHMLFTSTVPVIDFSWLQLKQQVYGSSSIVLPKRPRPLKDVQNILNLPELKITKPSDISWLSHGRCVRTIKK